MISLTVDSLKAYRAELLAKLTRPVPQTANCIIMLKHNMRSTAGRAHYRNNLISLNYRLLSLNPTHVAQTFAHELAHLVANELYGPESRGHGALWASIMRQFGFEASRCHTMDVSSLRRPHKTFNAYCACRTIKLKAGRYNKLRRGVSYTCLRCKFPLRLKPVVEPAILGANNNG